MNLKVFLIVIGIAAVLAGLIVGLYFLISKGTGGKPKPKPAPPSPSDGMLKASTGGSGSCGGSSSGGGSSALGGVMPSNIADENDLPHP